MKRNKRKSPMQRQAARRAMRQTLESVGYALMAAPIIGLIVAAYYAALHSGL